MSWLDTPKSDFLAVFEWFWNDWASTCDDLIFIVCGSATSWMADMSQTTRAAFSIARPAGCT